MALSLVSLLALVSGSLALRSLAGAAASSSMALAMAPRAKSSRPLALSARAGCARSSGRQPASLAAPGLAPGLASLSFGPASLAFGPASLPPGRALALPSGLAPAPGPGRGPASSGAGRAMPERIHASAALLEASRPAGFSARGASALPARTGAYRARVEGQLPQPAQELAPGLALEGARAVLVHVVEQAVRRALGRRLPLRLDLAVHAVPARPRPLVDLALHARVVAQVGDVDLAVAPVLGVEAVRAQDIAPHHGHGRQRRRITGRSLDRLDLGRRRAGRALDAGPGRARGLARSRQHGDQLVAIGFGRAHVIDHGPAVDRHQRARQELVERGEHRQDLAQPRVRRALRPGAQGRGVAEQHRRERVGAVGRRALPALGDQRAEEAVVVRGAAAIHVLAGNVPEHDLDQAPAHEAPARHQRAQGGAERERQAGADRGHGVRAAAHRGQHHAEEHGVDQRQQPVPEQPGGAAIQPQPGAEPDLPEQRLGPDAEHVVRHHARRRGLGPGRVRVHHHLEDVAVEVALDPAERRAVRPQGADRVDDELGLAVAPRAHDRQIDDGAHGLVVRGLGQRGQASHAFDFLSVEDGLPAQWGHLLPVAGRGRSMHPTWATLAASV